MSVDKVILRAFLSTLAAIVLLFGFMFTTLILVYPSTMMDFTYSLGMESSSIKYAKRAYERSDGKIYYIAHATQTAIEIESYTKINSCGMQFIKDEEFEDFCAQKNAKHGENAGDYAQYVYGQVCIAKYKCEEKQDAVDCAFAWTEKTVFPKNNAIVAVLLTALRAEDAETANMIKEKMNERIGELSESDKAYCDEVLGLIAG